MYRLSLLFKPIVTKEKAGGFLYKSRMVFSEITISRLLSFTCRVHPDPLSFLLVFIKVAPSDLTHSRAF